MGVSRSGVITMLNYLKNCVGTSPQCPNRAHQESIYGQFWFFYKFSLNPGPFFLSIRLLYSLGTLSSQSFYSSPIGLRHHLSFFQLNLALPVVRPYFHMGFAYVFSIGLFGPYRFDTWFQFFLLFWGVRWSDLVFIWELLMIFQNACLAPVGYVYISHFCLFYIFHDQGKVFIFPVFFSGQ